MAAQFEEGRGSAGAWLVIRARSRAMDRRRSRTDHLRVEWNVEEMPAAISTAASPETLAASGQISRSVARAMEQVPAEQRQAVELAFLSGLSRAEISHRVGAPLRTVRTRMRHGVVKLRELLQQERV